MGSILSAHQAWICGWDREASVTVWVWLAAPVIGLLLAMFGAGGGMTTVPLLTYGLQMPLKEAIASSLWIVAAVSVSALLRQRAWQCLDLPLLVRFALGGMVGSWLGGRIGLAISDVWQEGAFGVLACFVAWWMGRSGESLPDAVSNTSRSAKVLLTGVLMGVVTGVLGVGGGFVMVPALLWLGVPDYKQAVAHSLLLITINASVAGIGYLGSMHLQLVPIVTVALLAIGGSLLGSLLLAHWSSEHLQGAFRALLLLIGMAMLLHAVCAWCV